MNPLVTRFVKWFEGRSTKEKWFMSLLAFSLLATGALLNLGDTTSVAANPLDASPFYFLSAFFKTIVVLLLIVGSSIVYRRWGQIGFGSKVNKQMRVSETLRLSPRQALHLVTVGNQQLLIGATDQSIALLMPVDGNLAPLMDESRQTNLDFSSMLHSFDSTSQGPKE